MASYENLYFQGRPPPPHIGAKVTNAPTDAFGQSLTTDDLMENSSLITFVPALARLAAHGDVLLFLPSAFAKHHVQKIRPPVLLIIIIIAEP